MYAIIDDGGHQYRVQEGDRLEIQRRDLPEGEQTVEFDRVLLIGGSEDGPKVGTPVIEGAKVVADVLGEIKGDKITIQKLHRRKNYRRKTGHRQRYLQVRIASIQS